MRVKPAIILVSPKGPDNVGGIARLMGNFGVSDLRVVKPRCELFGLEARKRSMKAQGILEAAQVFDDLDVAQSDLHGSVAFSMQTPRPTRPQVRLPELFENAHFQKISKQPWGLIFGREESGLRAGELEKADLQASIPTEEAHSSLNLTSAVALVLYHWFEFQGLSRLEKNKRSHPLPKKNDENIFFQQLQELLVAVEFFNSPNATHIMKDIRDLFHRSQPNERELRVLFGILSDLRRRIGVKDHSVSSL